MESNVICPCLHCRGEIEFDTKEFDEGAMVICPHCGAETTLVIPPATLAPAETSEPQSEEEENNFTAHWPCDYCSKILEFAPADAGKTIECPYCAKQTVLYVPPAATAAATAAAAAPGSNADSPHIFTLSKPIATTGNEIAGRTIATYLGLARGTVVRSPDPIEGVIGGLGQAIGGNIATYARICEQARKEAFDRMIFHAMKMHADAVIAVRFDTTEFAPRVTEVFAYGTAVTLVK